MSKYNITAKVSPLKDQSKNVKAMASINIGGTIAINDMTIVESKNGNLFVGYPQMQDGKGEYRNVIDFLEDEHGKITKESLALKDEIRKTLVDMYKNGVKETPTQEGQDKEPVMHEVKAFVTPLRESQNATRGLATVQVGELFKINSIRINENMKEGTENFGKNFVAMPSRTNASRDSGYSDFVHPVHKEFGEALKGAVLKQYDTQLAYKNHAANKEQAAQQRDKPVTNKNAQGID